MPRLIVSPEHGKSFVFPLPASRMTIGRSRPSDLILIDGCCSSRHAEIFPIPNGYAIEDLNSKNGTTVNGRRVFRETELKHGDEIGIGATILRVDLGPAEDVLSDTDSPAPRSGTVFSVPEILGAGAGPPPVGPAGRAPGAPAPAGGSEFADIIEEVNRALVYSDLDFDRYLDRIMGLITERIPMDRGVLMLKDDATGQLAARVTRLSRHPRKAAGLPMSWSIIQTALGENQAILIPDTQSEPRWRDSESIIKAHIHSAMCVPLYDHKEITGVIYADRISVSHPFSSSNLRLLTFLASLAAGKIRETRQQKKIEDGRRLIEQLKQARRIQANLLPKSDPDFEPFEMSGRAVTSPTVGGDYFDYLPLGPTHMGIVIADVAGTGIGASLLMCLLSGSVQGEVGLAKDLGELSCKLNDIIYRKTEPNCFISFFMGVIDRATGEMVYINAGHNYPLLMNPAGNVQPLVSTGMCLGMLPDGAFETRTVTLGRGDLLCLYTDGIVEHRNRSREEFGETRLIESLRTSSLLPAHQVLDRVYEAVEAFSPATEPDDDMTVVILKRKVE